MAEPNWGLIRSGPAFEGLMQALVFFEDPRAVLFGRAGVDGGQDALSGDGLTVYQAKYNNKESFATALSDARAELKKIRRYRRPDHARYLQWRRVQNWVLVTNAAKNPGDHEKWEKLVPEFEKVGLKATYWSQEELDKKLIRFPGVRRSYFQGETRTLMSIPEAREWLRDQEYFLQRDILPAFEGREEELGTFLNFVESDDRFLLVHGAGGTGKSRLLLEGATQSALQYPLQVFWGSIESMNRSSSWFETIVPERRTILVLDEPEDTGVLRTLIEQVCSRASDWKIVVGVRSLKAPVLQTFDEPQHKRRTVELRIDPLQKEKAKSFARKLLDEGRLGTRDEHFKDEAAAYIAERFDGYPVWIGLAVSLLEENSHLNDLPQSVSALAERYLGRIHESLSVPKQKSYLEVLRWLSVIGTFNSEASAHQAFLLKATSIGNLATLKQALHKLTRQGIIRTRGARGRLFEVKPDVVRDHILIRWLTVEVGESILAPSAAAEELLQRAADSSLGPHPEQNTSTLLSTLARTQFYLGLSGVRVPLLEPFFRRLTSEVDRQMDYRTRESLLEALQSVALYCPEETLELLQRLRHGEVLTEGLPEGLQTKVLKLLCICLRDSGRLAAELSLQEMIIDELLAVAQLEIGICGQPTETIRCLRSLLTGGPYERASFDRAVSGALVRNLKMIERERADEGSAIATLAFCEPYFEIERHWTAFVRPKVSWGKITLNPQHPFWSLREPVKEGLLRVIEARVPNRELRIRAWKTVACTSKRVIPIRRDPQVRAELLALFRRIRQPLARAAADFEEVLEARESWHCHRKVRDPEVQAEVETLESIFREHELAGMAILLLSDRTPFEVWTQKVSQSAQNFASQGIDRVRQAMSEAESILRLREQEARVRGEFLFKAIGGLAVTDEGVAELIVRVLAGEIRVSNAARRSLAAGRFIQSRRQDPAEAGETLGSLLDACADGEVATMVIAVCLGYGVTSSEEYQTLKSTRESFPADQLPKYLALLGQAAPIDLLDALEEVSSVLESVEAPKRAECVIPFLKALCSSTHDRARLPPEFKDWLLKELVEDREGRMFENVGYEVTRIFRLCGGLSAEEFYGSFLEALVPSWTGIVGRERIVKLIPAGIPSHDVQERFLSNLMGNLYTFQLTELLQVLDRQGEWVPNLLLRQMQTSEPEQLVAFSSLASSYALGSSQWRQIARPALKEAQYLPKSKRVARYLDLCPKIWSVSGPMGDVPIHYQEQVELAERNLANETEECFRQFWEWRLEDSRRVYEDEAEDAKEERGE